MSAAALAEVPAVAPNAASAPWSNRFAGLNPGQRMKLAIGAALLVAIAVAAIVLGRQPDWRVLYANLADKDGGAIVAQLTTMNVPYRYTEGGGAIMVPADRVHDVRLRLASQGLPKGSVSGFELMEANRFGMTQFQEKLTFQRGLEGELTRSIQGMSAVQSARVHLALPNQNGFFREQQKPSASVLLSLYPGRTLDRAQLAGIVHLVASSVPEMSPSAVSVVDDTGKLLSATPDAASGVDAQQLQYAQQVEQQYMRRILDILEPVVGVGNVRAQVTADIDFSQSESTIEQHAPNLAPQSSAVRSQQVVEAPGGGAAGGNAQAQGVPGAASNQPAAASAAPINGAAVPLAAASAPGGAAAAAALGAGGRRETITNYEVDRTVRTVRAGTGNVRRVNAAVVVNHRKSTDAEGKVTQAAIPPEQIEQMTALVREAVGFNKERGDSVNLMNAPFQNETLAAEPVPVWKNPQYLDIARSFAWPVGLVLMALIVLMGFVRPGLKAWAASRPALPAPEAAPEPQFSALISDTPARPALPSPEQQAQDAAEQMRIEDARRLARQNPAAVANIVKNWVHGDQPA
ncbi:MAG: flagellar M-ring protein FliF [Burkholderiales bacterium]|nr:flagellar M-ring protein FliF [Burkholderiales bacterium]